MKHDEIRREDGRVAFGATDKTIGYAVLAGLLVLIGAPLLWWWPAGIGEFFQPWTLDIWDHPQALGYAMTIAIFGAALVVVGGYVSDRGRRHEIEFDADGRRVSVSEWWRGVDVELTLLFERFSGFEVHRPATRDDIWQLGLVLDNDSYWRLDRRSDREPLEKWADRLDEQFDFETSGRMEEVEPPERVDVEERDGRLSMRWTNWEPPLTRAVTTVGMVLFCLAVLAPVMLVFEGAAGLLAGAIGLGTALFAVPLFADGSRWLAGGFLAAWFVVALAAVAGLGAHWAYFPVATAGLAIFVRSIAATVRGFWDPVEHSLSIDDQGRIHEDGEVVEEGGEVLVARDFEGALANIDDIRPPTMELVWPGGREHNREGYLGRGQSPEDDHGHREPVEIEAPGLSLFEVVAVALIVDDEIRERSSPSPDAE